jgi:hypothetical protein
MAGGKFRLSFMPEAQAALAKLAKDRSAAKRLRAVRKTLGLLESNPRHPSLQTHEYSKLSGPRGQKVCEAYAENRTPAAFRVFWFYGPEAGQMTIIAITPHP